MKCFYHRVDHDGLCSAAIVKRAHPEAVLVGIDYGEPFPWEEVGPSEEVWMVDFSLPIADMAKLAAYTRSPEGFYNLIWIDHHKTAIDAAAGQVFKGLQAVGVGACELTWGYCFPGTPAPLIVRLLAAYDVWDHSDINAVYAHYGLRVDGPEDPAWAQLFVDNQLCAVVVAEGELIYDYIQKDNADKAACLCFDTRIGGLWCLAANYGPGNSQFFDSKWDASRYDAMCLFSWRPGTGKWRVSLYTTNASIDVGAVAKQFGGGGHKGAAAFLAASILDLGLEPKTAEVMAQYKDGFGHYYGAMDK